MGLSGVARAPAPRIWFYAGLFLTTLATLTIEILDTRLLSVLTWYHLSFFAVSTAMFGMSAGAVRVYLGGAAFEGERAARALARYGGWFALALPVSHVVNLCIPIETAQYGLTNLLALGLSTLVLAVPFYLSGIVVSIALTRIPGPSGRVYAVDLLGAALGCLFVVLLLDRFALPSAVLVCSAVGALAAASFRVFAGAGRPLRLAACAALLVVAAYANDLSPRGLRVLYPQGSLILTDAVEAEFWTLHGHVMVWKPSDGLPHYWGPGNGARRYRANTRTMAIDGGAGSALTRWNGRPASLGWAQHDVTSLPYHLRRRGDVAVIGVGGGRDLLTAIWAESRSVTGIEINRAFLDILEDHYRDYAKLADRAEVTLVHDEARSWLTRTEQRFDVLQMSLTDTWAATGAGAFTLSENGLYTVEAWDVFLDVLAPGGILSVSRWYAPEVASETNRLVALATAALLDRGVASPARHLALVSSGKVATLLVSNEPLRPADLRTIESAARRYGFEMLLVPGRPQGDASLERIATSGSAAELLAAVADADYDYTPPTDQRPYFFNILKPGWLLRGGGSAERPTGVMSGNLQATYTLALLWLISALLVATVILGPLWRAGLPALDGGAFAEALAYFALIGLGYMLAQIALIQRFSVFLGHPTYAVAVILFSTILATGLGSLLSDRIPLEERPRWALGVPLGIAAILLGVVMVLPALFDAGIHLGLFARCAIVVAVVTCVALPLGFCFPFGLRIVRRLSDEATPWLWGVNGACSVLASVSAVAISMWSGIDTSLLAAALAYGLIALPATALLRRPPVVGR